jgi:multiple sugar transport system substrate-binding protein
MQSQWTRRRFLAALSASGAALGSVPLLEACGSGSSSSGTVELTWAMQNNAENIELATKVAKQYNASQKKGRLKVLSYPGTTTQQYQQKLLSDLTAGTLPDLLAVSDNFVKPFFQQHLIADLKPLAQSAHYDLSKFNKLFMSLARYQNKVGFLPRAADVVVMYYNKRMFGEAGVSYPTADWTTGDFLAAAEKLTKRSGNVVTQWGATAQYDWWAYWVPLVVAEGGEILSSDHKRTVFNSSEGVRAWNIIFTGLKNGWFCPPSTQNAMGNPYAPFASAKAAMTFTIRDECVVLREQLKDDWDVQLVPKGGAQRKSGMGTTGYGISSGTKNRDAAWDALQYIFTTGLDVFMKSYLVVPPITTDYKSPAWRNLPPPPHNNQVFVDALDYAMTPPPLPFYTTGPFATAVDNGISAVLLGQQSAQQAVNGMVAAANQALQQGG